MQKSLQGTEDPATQEEDKPWEGGTQGGVPGGGLAVGLPKARRASSAYSMLSCWCPAGVLSNLSHLNVLGACLGETVVWRRRFSSLFLHFLSSGRTFPSITLSLSLERPSVTLPSFVGKSPNQHHSAPGV